MIIAICNSTEEHNPTGPDLIYRTKKLHHRIKVTSSEFEYVIVEIEECDPSDPSVDPLVIKLDSNDTVVILWRQRIWKLVDSSAIALISIMAGIGTVMEDEIGDSIIQLRSRLKDGDDG
jgi:hypothetical protein